MRRVITIFSKVVMLTSILIIFSISHSTDVEAYFWSSNFGQSPKVEKVGDEVPTIDEKALNFRLTSESELKVFGTNGLLRESQSMFTTVPYLYLQRGEKVKITKVAVQNGKYLDLLFTNVNTIDNSNNTYINIRANGATVFYRKNVSARDNARTFLNMKVVKHDTGEEIPNTTFYLPSYMGSINYSAGRFVTGYDKKLTNKYLIGSSDQFAKDHLWLDNTTSELYDLITSNGYSTTSEGFFTIYGSTGSNGYLYGVESGVNTASAVFFFDPTQISIIPNKYPDMAITKTASSLENGTKMSITMVQDLPGQRTDNYIPVNDSFELTINEKNTGFLNILSSDFKLSIDGVQLPNDGSAYKLTSKKSGDTTSIKINITTEYLKKINTKTNLGKKITIVQTSTVTNDQEKITTAIKDASFSIPVIADLTYTLQNGLEEEIPTPEEEVELSLIPRLAADVSSNTLVYQGMTLKDININNLVKNLHNEDYAWDEVTATFDNPTSVLTALGAQTIPVTLKSSTFGNIKKISVPVTVEKAPIENGVLSWDSTINKPTTTKKIQLNQEDLTTIVVEDIFWKTTARDRNYSIVVSNSEKLTKESIISTMNVSNGAQVNTYMEKEIKIPTDQLKVGTNNIFVQLFPKDNVNPGETIQALDKVSLTIELTGQLKLVSVPTELKWTGRTISKGVLPRDAGNEMEVKVLDTRNIPEADKTWYVSAQTEVVDKAKVPFDLQWKSDKTATPISLSEKQIALTKKETTQSGGSYSKTWDKDSGVVLYAKDYLGIGDYSNKVKVIWNLYDTPTVN